MAPVVRAELYYASVHGDRYVVTVDGHTIGAWLSKHEAAIVAEWLERALPVLDGVRSVVRKNADLEVEELKKLGADDLKWAIERNARLIVALQQIYRLEGPGLDGSSENASGRIARLALEAERVTEKRNCEMSVDNGPCGMLHPCPRHTNWADTHRAGDDEERRGS